MTAKKRQAKNSTAMIKRGRLYLRLFYGFLFLVIVKYIFFTRVTIGHDKRYFIFVFLIPVLAGLLVMFYLWRKRVTGDIRETKGFLYKTVLGLLFLMMGVFCAFTSFGLAADIVWETANRAEAARNPEETMQFTVDHFDFGKREAVWFRFRNRAEKIRCSYKSISAYRNSPPERYIITLAVQKGIWGYYIVNNWYISPAAQ